MNSLYDDYMALRRNIENIKRSSSTILKEIERTANQYGIEIGLRPMDMPDGNQHYSQLVWKLSNHVRDTYQSYDIVEVAIITTQAADYLLDRLHEAYRNGSNTGIVEVQVAFQSNQRTMRIALPNSDKLKSKKRTIFKRRNK